MLRRHIKSKPVREAEKWRSQSPTRHAMQRLGRAASLTGASGIGVVAYGLAVAPLGAAGLITVGTATLIAAGTVLSWPKRPASQQKISRAELMALCLEAEDWLLAERAKLPGRAIPALDSIFLRLGDLHPHIMRLNPNGPVAGICAACSPSISRASSTRSTRCPAQSRATNRNCCAS